MTETYAYDSEVPHEATSVSDIKEYFDFADAILGVDWGEGGVPEEYTPEYISAHPNDTRVFVIRDKNNKIIAGTKIKKLDPDTTRRLELNTGNLAKQQGALLEYTAVHKDFQNKGLLKPLTEKRTEWSKMHEINYICAEIELTRPISAWTKIRDGFIFTNIEEPGAGIPHPYFVAVKPITDYTPTIQDTKKQPEWKEVIITEDSHDELKKLFLEGWVGVDTKFDTDACPWTLILEKKDKV